MKRPSMFIYCVSTDARQHVQVCMFRCEGQCDEYQKRMKEIGEWGEEHDNNSR